MSEAAIQNAMEAARIFLNNTAERRLYINREMARMDRESQLEVAHEDGFRAGLKKGVMQGRKEEAISNTIHNLNNLMSQMKFSLSEAMDLLGFQKISEKSFVKRWKSRWLHFIGFMRNYMNNKRLVWKIFSMPAFIIWAAMV